MTKTEYTIEIAVSLDHNAELSLIELAGKVYRRRGTASLPNRKLKSIRCNEFINGPETALIELVEANPLFEDAGVRLIMVGCGPSSVASAGRSQPGERSTFPEIYLR